MMEGENVNMLIRESKEINLSECNEGLARISTTEKDRSNKHIKDG